MRSKKLFALLLAAVMVFGSFSMAFAEEPALLGATPKTLGATVDAKLDLSDQVVILHSNDVHGAIAGYAYMKALKDWYAAAGAEVIVVDAGDFSQGNTFVSVSKGENAIAMMNLVGYDYATFGNHEFDYGYEQLKANLEKATFTALCSDVLENGKTIGEKSVVVEKGGVKIGLFGLATPESQTKANPALISSLTFLSEANNGTLYSETQKVVDELKEKCDIVICLAHFGVDGESEGHQSYDLVKNVSGIDFVIDGHSHTVMTEGTEGQKIQSTGTAFDNIGAIIISKTTKKIVSNRLHDLPEITINKAEFQAAYKEAQKIEDADEKAEAVNAAIAGICTYAEGYEYDEAVANTAKFLMSEILIEYGEAFATTEFELNGGKTANGDFPNGNRDGETNNGDLIADALLWHAKKYGKDTIEVDADHMVAITNGGGIRAAIKVGDVTKDDINAVLPFGNTVYCLYVSGAELLESLEASTYDLPNAMGAFPQTAGIEFYVNVAKKYDANPETYPDSTYYGPASINRVTITSVNGKPFSMDDTYLIVTNNFCGAGGDTYYAFKAATSGYDTGVPMDEAVIEYIVDELDGVIGVEYAQPRGSFKTVPFLDIAEDSWYEDAVVEMYLKGIINGVDKNAFNPAGNLSRAQVVTMLWRLNGGLCVNYAAGFDYKDFVEGEWYSEAARWAAAEGIINGYDGYLNLGKDITREEFATILYRYAIYKGVDADAAVAEVNTLSFDDAFTVSEWAKSAVHWCAGTGIITGIDNNIVPTGFASRAQGAVMLSRMIALQ